MATKGRARHCRIAAAILAADGILALPLASGTGDMSGAGAIFGRHPGWAEWQA